jgi:1,2-phenylacetyl-CoA epoxidase catalytic subunit
MYLDVIVIGHTFKQHLLSLQKVFQQFREGHLSSIQTSATQEAESHTELANPKE